MEDTSTVWCIDCQMDIPAVLEDDHVQRHEKIDQRPDPEMVLIGAAIVAVGVIAGVIVANL